MATVTVTPEGKTMLSEEALTHWGVHPGESVELELLPNGHIAPAKIRPERTGTWADLSGFLKDKTNVVLTVEEITEGSGPEWEG